MSLTKEQVLRYVDSYDILNHYLAEFTGGKQLKQGDLICSPFREEKNPSFNIYRYNGTNEYRWKDFGDDHGDCISFVIKRFNITFPEALQKIMEDFNIDAAQVSGFTSQKLPKKDVIKGDGYSVVVKDFSEKELGYFLSYGITIDQLKKFNVVSVDNFTAKNKDGKKYTIRSNDKSYIFGYRNGIWIKIYKPLEKKFRFQHLGKKPEKFIFGFEQLPDKDDLMFITGGEKDVLTLAAQGYHAISLNSETSHIESDTVAHLKTRFNNIILLYDTDETGVKHSQKLSEQHNLLRIILPKLENGKDISDYFKADLPLAEFQKMISECLQVKKPTDNEDRKFYYYNALELLALDSSAQRYLVEPLLPATGTAVLVGKPDTGKSQLVRFLAESVCLGCDKFLGFDLHTNHQSALFIATEDDAINTRYLLDKQLQGMKKKMNEQLHFLFADTLTQEEIMEEFQWHLSNVPCDLVVIDSFGDIFKGTDLNSNFQMRSTVREFDRIGKKFGCLILFVHHTTKNSYSKTPAQEHIQGGAGLVQKVRSALYLSPGVGNLKYLNVVKGNYCPQEYKDKAIELMFDEEFFIFTTSGRFVPIQKLPQETKGGKSDDKLQLLISAAQLAFSQHEKMRYTDLVKVFKELTGQSEATAKRNITLLKEANIIAIDKKNMYYLQIPSSADFNVEPVQA